jgi:hypothetical protein
MQDKDRLVALDWDALYAQVPADFPRPERISAVSGFQAKVAVSQYNRNYYASGSSPQEIAERWDICRDLAKQLKGKALASKAEKRSAMAEVDILDQYLTRLIRTKWTSEAEARWIIRCVAEMLSWEVPAAAVEAIRGSQV